MRGLLILIVTGGLVGPILLLSGAANADPITINGCAPADPCEGHASAAAGCGLAPSKCVIVMTDVPAPVGRHCFEILPVSEWPPPFLVYDC